MSKTNQPQGEPPAGQKRLARRSFRQAYILAEMIEARTASLPRNVAPVVPRKTLRKLITALRGLVRERERLVETEKQKRRELQRRLRNATNTLRQSQLRNTELTIKLRNLREETQKKTASDTPTHNIRLM